MPTTTTMPGINAVNAKITAPGDVNYSDDELAFMPLYAHLALTPGAAVADPELVIIMRDTLN